MAFDVWLNYLHDELPSKGISSQLDGYDINPINFPAPSYLPSSVTLKKLDILARPLPEEMMGAYDSPSPETSTTACNTIVHILDAGGKSRGSTFEFLGGLDRHVKEHEFEDVHRQESNTHKQDWKAWTQDYLMVWEEPALFFPPKAKQPQAPLARELWVELFAKAVWETEQGVSSLYEAVLGASMPDCQSNAIHLGLDYR
ncbi:hypothetical protein F4818DRAFT_445642 [Hypoxylon cercidicola]|nr:hypothetical protein F4818DRAFT_445642 [Hypoxylon cercidicola]